MKTYTEDQLKQILLDWESFRNSKFGEATHNMELHHWLVNIGGTLTSPDQQTRRSAVLPEPSEGCKQWLNDVHEGRISEARYERASKLEKLLRYSTGGTNHKYLIDDFIEDILDPGRKERAAKMIEIKADPNYEKYKAEINGGFKVGSQEFISLFLLHKMLEETPPEQLKEDFDAVTASGVGSESPTVDEYFQSLNPTYMHYKGYSEGAQALADKLCDRLANDERPVIPIAEVIALISHIIATE